jgi:hypothetical protein
LFGKLVYLKLRHDGFTARFVPGDRVIDTDRAPHDYPAREIAAAFGHERVILGDFELAEKLLAKMIRELHGSRGLIKPVVIARIEHRFVNSITTTEILALLSVIERAGARRVYVWMGRELTDEELRERNFPSDGVAISNPDTIPMDRLTRSAGPTTVPAPDEH